MNFAAFGACGRNLRRHRAQEYAGAGICYPMNMPKKGRVAGARNIPELPHPFFQEKALMLFGDQDVVKMIAMSAGHLPVVRTGRRIVAVRVDNVDGSVRTGTQNLHIGMRPAHLAETPSS